LALSAAAALGSWLVTSRLDAVGRSDALLELALAGAAFALIYLAGCWRAGILGREELAVLRAAVSGGPTGTDP
jgi:hypothetical protein